MSCSRALQRRQAHPSIRGATGMDSCGLRISRPSPPHPPTMENPLAGVISERSGGRPIAFYYRGGRGVFVKPVDCTPQHPANPHGSKQKCPTGFPQNPRVESFYPRFALFCPRVCFRLFPPSPLSISLFSLRKESEREDSGEAEAIHGFFFGQKIDPRNCYNFDSYSVDENSNWGTLSPYKSMTYALSPEIPRSTGKNAYTPLQGGSQ